MQKAVGIVCVGLIMFGFHAMAEAGEGKGPMAVIEMDAGKIVIELYEKDAPETGASSSANHKF